MEKDYTFLVTKKGAEEEHIITVKGSDRINAVSILYQIYPGDMYNNKIIRVK